MSSSESSDEMVQFYDVDEGILIKIPKSELAPGVVQVRIQGIEGLVWVDPAELTPGPIRHEEFDEEVRDCIRHIHKAFQEHRDLSFEEWEDGFRRDGNPMQEIALWLHAASVYQAYAAEEPDLARRVDFYTCVITCLTTSPEMVWSVLKLEVLSRPEAEQVVAQYFEQE